MTNDNETVVPFKPRLVTPEVTPSDPDIIEMLERYLKAAKSGNIKFIAVAIVDHRDIAVTTWEPSATPANLVTSALGAVTFLNHRFGAAADDGGSYTDELKQ